MGIKNPMRSALLTGQRALEVLDRLIALEPCPYGTSCSPYRGCLRRRAFLLGHQTHIGEMRLNPLRGKLDHVFCNLGDFEALL